MLAPPAFAMSREAAFVGRYMALPDKPMPRVYYWPQGMVGAIAHGSRFTRGAYSASRNAVYIAEEHRGSREIMVHELVHWAGGGECAAYTVEIEWLKAHGRTPGGLKKSKARACDGTRN